MTYIVTAPLVVSKKADESDLYLYEGAVVPDGTPADTIKRLSSLGMIRELSKAEAAAPPPPPVAESN